MSLLGHYHPDTDTIRGCTEGTITWWHEKGHQKQHHEGKVVIVEMWTRYFLICAVWCIVFGLSGFDKFFIVSIFGMQFYLEIDAWIYALKNRKRDVQDDGL